MCGAEDETRRADAGKLCGTASQGRRVKGEAEADSRRPAKTCWEAYVIGCV